MLIETPDPHSARDTATPVETRPAGDRKLRAIALAVCIVFSALVWIAIAKLF